MRGRFGEHRQRRHRKRPRRPLTDKAFAPILIESVEVALRPSNITGFKSALGAQRSPAYVVCLASKASAFRIDDSDDHCGHDKRLRIFVMEPGVVETWMPKSMQVRDFCNAGDLTNQAQVSNLALALVTGTLGAFTERFMWAGADTEELLVAAAT